MKSAGSRREAAAEGGGGPGRPHEAAGRLPRKRRRLPRADATGPRRPRGSRRVALRGGGEMHEVDPDSGDLKPALDDAPFAPGFQLSVSAGDARLLTWETQV